MTERSSVVVGLVNGRPGETSVGRLKSAKQVSSSPRRKDETAGRRISRGRQMAEQIVAKFSTAAAAAAAWKHPSPGSTTSAADDSGFGSTAGYRTGTATLPDNRDASTTPMSSSSSVDWLDTDCRVPGTVGIVNDRNKCFISAVVQCLSNTPAFVVHALSPILRPRQLRREADELGRELSKLLRAIWSGGGCSTDRSKSFHRAVRQLASSWYTADDQHDAHEFAVWLLNRLRDERFGADEVDGHLRHPTPAVDNVQQTVYTSTIDVLGSP